MSTKNTKGITIPEQLQSPPVDALFDAIHIADKLKFIRETLGISESELGRRFGVGQYNISRYENLKREPNIYLPLAVIKWAEELERYLASQQQSS